MLRMLFLAALGYVGYRVAVENTGPVSAPQRAPARAKSNGRPAPAARGKSQGSRPTTH